MVNKDEIQTLIKAVADKKAAEMARENELLKSPPQVKVNVDLEPLLSEVKKLNKPDNTDKVIAALKSLGDSLKKETEEKPKITFMGGGGGMGASQIDKVTYTSGSSSFAPIGGVFNDVIGTVAGQAGAGARITQYRAIHTNLRDSSGSELGTATNPIQVGNITTTITLVPSATQTGLSVDRQTALTNTTVAVKTTSGRLYGYNFFNPGTTLAYVHFYDAGLVGTTVGTTTPKMSIALPSNVNSSVGDDLVYPIPVTFSNAITIAASTTPGGGTAPGTSIVTNCYFI